MPEATVAAIIEKNENGVNKFLVTLRNHEPFNGMWCIPGGHIDDNEPVEGAICREVKEETNLDFSGKYFGYFEEIFPSFDIHNVVLVFIGPASGTLINQAEEVSASKWITQKEASQIKMAFGHNRIIEAYMELQKENTI